MRKLCRHCGRCVGKCPFHSIPDGTYGFKIYIGGRWGKKISHGKALSKIFTSEEEALDVIEKAILLFKDQGIQGRAFCGDHRADRIRKCRKTIIGKKSSGKKIRDFVEIELRKNFLLYKTAETAKIEW